MDGLDDLIEGYHKERRASHDWRDYGEGNKVGVGEGGDETTTRASKVGVRENIILKGNSR